MAIPFGGYDPRSMAMGGVGVSTATAVNAGYYNPAMLSRYKVRKEKSDNSRFTLPGFTIRYSEAIERIDEFEDQDLDGQLSDAITAFNTTLSTADAQIVVDRNRVLQSGLDEITRGPFAFDFHTGITLGIGGRNEGGSLFVNARIAGDGVIIQTPEDRQLLNEYTETMEYYASTGTIVGAPYPGLFNAGGQLIDQTGNLTSSASGTFIVLTELGMSFARKFDLLGQKIAIGVTPKYVKVATYDMQANAASRGVFNSEQLSHDAGFNFDIGVDKVFNKQWRAGMVIKNIISRDYQTALGNTVELEPQARLGAAYSPHWGLLAVDADLTVNKAVGAGDDSQVIAFGGEWRLGPIIHLQMGYQQNLKATGDHTKGLISGGVEAKYSDFRWHLTYAGNDVEQAYAAGVTYQF